MINACAKSGETERAAMWLERSSAFVARSCLLGGSWVVLSRVIGRVTILIIHIRGLITPLITTPKP